MRRSQKKASVEGQILLYLLAFAIGIITFLFNVIVSFLSLIITFIGEGLEYLHSNPIALLMIGAICTSIFSWWIWQKYLERSGKLEASISTEIIIKLTEKQTQYYSRTDAISSQIDALELINKRMRKPLWHGSERKTKLIFEFIPGTNNCFELLQEGFSSLLNSQKRWRIIEEQQTWNFKRYAGASTLLQRRKFSFSSKPPPYLFINRKIYSIADGKVRVFFMPDNVYVYNCNHYEIIPYSKIFVNVSASRFVEEGEIPSDTEVVGYTWQYMRKDGGPDLRFNRNRKIPVALYGQVEFLIPNLFTLKLHISSVSAAQKFSDSWSVYTTGDFRNSKQQKGGSTFDNN